MKVTFKQKLDYFLFGWIIRWAFPQYNRPKYGYTTYRNLFFYFFIPQKILRINGKVPWPVHYTSRVTGVENITKGVMCDPGDMPGMYVQAIHRIVLGNRIEFGPGVKLISTNHRLENYSEHEKKGGIRIGNNVWIGANSIVLPGVEIGDNVVIGAGSVVVKNIPPNTIAVGNPCKVIKEKTEYLEELERIIWFRKAKIK